MNTSLLLFLTLGIVAGTAACSSSDADGDDGSDAGSGGGAGDDGEGCNRNDDCEGFVCSCDGGASFVFDASCTYDEGTSTNHCRTAAEECPTVCDTGSGTTDPDTSSGSGETDGSGAGGPGASGAGAGDSQGSGTPTHPECEAFADRLCECNVGGSCTGEERAGYVDSCEISFGTAYGNCSMACVASGGTCGEKSECVYGCSD